MAKTISPGVFTEERDQSFLTQGVEQIGGAFVGPTAKGPAYEPTVVTSPADYIQTFGNGGFYTDRAAIEYLREAGQATVVRVLGGSPSARDEEVAGYVDDTYEVKLDSSDDLDGVTASVFAPTKEGGDIDTVTITGGDFRDFTLEISLSGGGTKTYMLSLDPSDRNYVKDVLGQDPRGFTELYVAADFEEFHDFVISEWEGGAPLPVATIERQDDGANYDNLAFDNGRTPWIESQDLLESQPAMTEKFRLFRIHSQSSGTDSNREIKVAVENIRLPDDVPGDNYGRFDVVVRAYEDTDANPDVLETFTDLTLEPGQPNYIARAIGNRSTEYTASGALKIQGEYDNVSNYIRIEMNDEIVAANEDGRDDRAGLVPWGFQGYQYPLETDGSTLPAGVKYRETQAVEDYEYEVDLSGSGDAGEWVQTGSVDRPFDTNIYHGVDFTYDHNETFFAPLSEADDVFVSEGFNLSDIYEDSASNRREDPSTGDRLGTTQAERKFVLGFQGGFDGMDPTKPLNKGEDITATNTQGFDCSSFNSSGTLAYRDAFGVLSNEDEVDMNLLVTPGIIKTLHPAVTDAGIQLVEDRGDSFYVLDAVGPDASIQAVTQATSDLNSNYAGTYYPWVRSLDSTTNRIVELPPSALMPRVYAFNDNVGFQWDAPAGLTRGGVGSARETVVRLNQDQRDELYSSRVNPIAQYEGDVVVWGQKTLQAVQSALDRINVRRLLLRLKKFIASSARFLVFEPNNANTRDQFRDLVVPFMDRVQQQGGVQNYRIKMDAENNPPEVRDRNILRGQIGIQPTQTAEFIDLTFTVLPSGAEFPGDDG
jgi:hypothetical protein